MEPLMLDLNDVLSRYGLKSEEEMEPKCLSSLYSSLHRRSKSINKTELLNETIAYYILNNSLEIKDKLLFIKRFGLSDDWLKFPDELINKLSVLLDASTDSYGLRIRLMSVRFFLNILPNKHILCELDASYRLSALFDNSQINRELAVNRVMNKLEPLISEFNSSDFEPLKQDLFQTFVYEHERVLEDTRKIFKQ